MSGTSPSATTTPLQTPLGALLVDLSNAPAGPAQQHLIEQILRVTDPLHRSIAAELCRFFRLDRNTWADEFSQTVRTTAWRLLREIAGSPANLAKIKSYRAILTYRSHHAATEFVDSTEGLSQSRGEKTQRRRLAEAARTREEFIRRGIPDPSTDQIIEATNRRLLARNPNAANQGMLLTRADFTAGIDPAAAIDDADRPVAGPEQRAEGSLFPGERERLVAACITACRAEDARQRRTPKYVALETVAYIWFGGAGARSAEEWDGPPSTEAISSRLGVAPSVVRQKVAQVRSISQAVAERFTSLGHYEPTVQRVAS